MRTRSGSLVLLLASLWLAPGGAGARSFTFNGTTPDTNVNVRFTADLSISGDTLTLELTNDSLNWLDENDNIVPSSSLNPNDLLTSFYFDVFNGVSRPTLNYTGASGNVCFTANPGADNCDLTDWPGAANQTAGSETNLIATAVNDNTWEFKSTSSDPGFSAPLQFGSEELHFGVGTAGNFTFGTAADPPGPGANFNGNIVGNWDFGIYAGDVSTNNIDDSLLVNGSIIFTWSGANGFTDADIGDEVVFGLGTNPDSTGFVPEPATGLLLGTGLLGLAWRGRRS